MIQGFHVKKIIFEIFLRITSQLISIAIINLVVAKHNFAINEIKVNRKWDKKSLKLHERLVDIKEAAKNLETFRKLNIWGLKIYYVCLLFL